MFAFVKGLFGIESESDSSDSESEFSSINSSDYDDDSDNDNNDNENNDNERNEKQITEDQADFQKGDRCSFKPHGHKKWSNAVILKYRYPDQFTLKIEDSGRLCLGIKREQLHLPIKVIPITTSLTYKKGEVVDVIRKKSIRTVEDAKKELEMELGETNQKSSKSGKKRSVKKVISSMKCLLIFIKKN